MSEKKHGVSPANSAGESPETWREDFPTEWAADNYISRREFTRFLVLTSGATFVGNGYFVLKSALAKSRRRADLPPMAIGHVDDLHPGDVKLFRYPTNDDPAMLIRLESGDLVAYRQRCTHLSCPVHYQRETNQIECPCHNGLFDAATGRVLAGPPPRPLPRIALRIENGAIFADGLEVQGRGEEGNI